MTYYITSSQARQAARTNLTIFDEINAIMRAVMIESDNGGYSVTIDGGTTMTQSRPVITYICPTVNPTVSSGDTLEIANTTITLGVTGTSLLAIVADINESGVDGLTASKNADSKLVLSYTCAASDWTLPFGIGAANTALGIPDNFVVEAVQPISVDYFRSWAGTDTERKYDDEISKVRKYFENIGYQINILKNTDTATTFKWVVNW